MTGDTVQISLFSKEGLIFLKTMTSDMKLYDFIMTYHTQDTLGIIKRNNSSCKTIGGRIWPTQSDVGYKAVRFVNR